MFFVQSHFTLYYVYIFVISVKEEIKSIYITCKPSDNDSVKRKFTDRPDTCIVNNCYTDTQNNLCIV